MTIDERERDQPDSDENSQDRDADAETGESMLERRRRIAVAAYHKAERRGFDGNRALDDWLDAEKEIDSQSRAGGIQHEASTLSEGPTDISGTAVKEATNDTAEPGRIEPDEVRRWARKLKVPAERLREAIQRVGPVVNDVKRYLETTPTQE
jgi:Protein of unknown function (DUF2934)/Protein of unknown function (DUF3606)